jgi:hypothetical protein
MAADVKCIMRCWDDLKSLRLNREGEWQDIADYFRPRQGFQVTPRNGELIRRRVTSSAGPKVLAKSAALQVGYLIDVSRPFVGPNVDRGLAQAGRKVDLDADELDYLDTVQWAMFDRMLLPQSGFMQAISRTVLDFNSYGTGINWTGRKRGFGPRYQNRPLRACWIAENDDGEVDTLYFAYRLPAWRVALKFPEGVKNTKIATWADDDKDCKKMIQILHIVEPRECGMSGAVATNKPFKAVQLAVDEQIVLEESGYETFPYAVPRLNMEDGSAYGTGLAWMALPNIKVINALMQWTELAVALRVNPPLMKPERLFGKPLDRRPGALNSFNPANLGFQNAKDAIQQLMIAGDVNTGVEWLRYLTQDVEEIFFTDWMRTNDGVQKTAEEIRDTRDLRVRGMTALVPSLDRDLIGKTADRTLEAMKDEGQLPNPPPKLGGKEVDWDYKGPLAMLQLRGQSDAILKLFRAAEAGTAFDQQAGLVINVAEGLRTVAEAEGVPLGVLRSRDEVLAAQQKAADAQQQQQDMAATSAAATALRDGGQGMASVLGAGGGRGAAPQAAAPQPLPMAA